MYHLVHDYFVATVERVAVATISAQRSTASETVHGGTCQYPILAGFLMCVADGSRDVPVH
jgi:hypothetical protein